MHKNGNNTNIGIRGFTTWKQKNPVTKCYQVVQEQKFKDLRSSTRQTSPERIVLDLESEV